MPMLKFVAAGVHVRKTPGSTFAPPRAFPCKACLFVCLSVFVCVCVCLTSSVCSSVSRCVSTSLSLFPSLSLCLSPSASLAVCSSVSLSVCLSVSVCLSRSLYMSYYVCLSVCLYVCLSVCLRARACCSGTSFERPGQQRGPRAQPGSQTFPESAGGEAERVDRQESSEGGSRGVRRIGEVHACHGRVLRANGRRGAMQ